MVRFDVVKIYFTTIYACAEEVHLLGVAMENDNIVLPRKTYASAHVRFTSMQRNRRRGDKGIVQRDRRVRAPCI